MVNRCKQSKLPQTKAKSIEIVKFNEGIRPVKGNISKEEKQCSMAYLRNNGFKSGNINMGSKIILDLPS